MKDLHIVVLVVDETTGRRCPTNVNQGHDTITPQVYVVDINRALAFNGQGRSSQSHTPPIPDEPIWLAEEVSALTSNGYTPSPPPRSDMEQSNQPINLSSLLNLLGRDRGRGTVRGRGAPHGHGSSQSLILSHGRRGPTQSDTPLGFSPKEIEAVSIRDSVYSKGTALALSQAFMLPGDMQREVESSPDNLLAPNEELAEEEGGSLDKDLNANVSEQHSTEAEQIGKASNPGQKEASGGSNNGSTVVEDTHAQVTPPPLQDQTIEK
ncbi:hypothetical protein RHSIM_Rhsim10G0122900 [Rhododendron simsii]|uniref:Uncharacterized protein n=1 Tax=Rhododendron simsii TaxID=118357 RepID=A0A834LDA2_RHOSS|nr:hypothetical protein RHSIM_Rhsim10G0122900 [Rhododendron simsii]